MITLRSAFPDETVRIGQRINMAQAAILNRLIQDQKARPDGWIKIDDSTPAGHYLLYFPATEGRNAQPAWWQVDRYPVHYSRKPTHYKPLTAPTEDAGT
jgi:hypothetical protein